MKNIGFNAERRTYIVELTSSEYEELTNLANSHGRYDESSGHYRLDNALKMIGEISREAYLLTKIQNSLDDLKQALGM